MTNISEKYSIEPENLKDIKSYLHRGLLTPEEAVRMIIKSSRSKDIKKLMKYLYGV